ncbi:LytR/AlgR family response regulator transcription factor [Bacteroidota bacterium]
MLLINCIAIDDEPPALRQMKDYIVKVPYLKLLATFDNAIDAMSYLKEEPVDLVFLDIQMENLSGIEFLKLQSEKPGVILTTAYDSFALEAFNLDVDDYLLKPISFDRFLKATEKIYNKLLLQKQQVLPDPEKKNNEDFFFVKTEFRIQRIDFKEILYIEGMKEYLIIHLENEKVYTLQSFNEILSSLPESNFVRVHKSYIISLRRINSVQKNKIFIKEKAIPIGNTYKEAFLKRIK